MSRRHWTRAEDERLTSLVQQFGDQRGYEGKWREIAKSLTGRTSKDCRKRWFHSLDPSLRKGRWSREEDEILVAAYQTLGPAWKQIALLIPGRKDDQCAKRYNEILNPCAQNRLHEWTTEEDIYLTTKVAELGHSWSAIAAGLHGRPPLTCRNRWRSLQKSRSRISPSTTSYKPSDASVVGYVSPNNMNSIYSTGVLTDHVSKSSTEQESSSQAALECTGNSRSNEEELEFSSLSELSQLGAVTENITDMALLGHEPYSIPSAQPIFSDYTDNTHTLERHNTASLMPSLISNVSPSMSLSEPFSWADASSSNLQSHDTSWDMFWDDLTIPEMDEAHISDLFRDQVTHQSSSEQNHNQIVHHHHHHYHHIYHHHCYRERPSGDGD